MVAQATPGTQFNVGGILLDQPFKIRRLGHFGFNVVDIDERVRFYTDLLGFRISDVMDFDRGDDPASSMVSATATATSCATAATTTPSCCSTRRVTGRRRTAAPSRARA